MNQTAFWINKDRNSSITIETNSFKDLLDKAGQFFFRDIGFWFMIQRSRKRGSLLVISPKMLLTPVHWPPQSGRLWRPMRTWQHVLLHLLGWTWAVIESAWSSFRFWFLERLKSYQNHNPHGWCDRGEDKHCTN